MATTVTCANCKEPAVYSYIITSSKDVKYCSRDLPKFLKSPEYASRVVKVVPLPEVIKEEAPKTSKKKTAPAPVVESEPVVAEEESVVEDVQEDNAPEVSEEN